MSFFTELKRRNVFRVGLAYVVTSWLLLQLTEVLMEILDLPSQIGKTILLLLIIGLVPALILAWAFELTPDGIRRDSDVDHEALPAAKTGRVMDRMIIVMLIIALAYFVWESRFSGPNDTAIDPRMQSAKPVATEPVAVETIEAESPAPNPDELSVAVLPFVNMSADQSNEYFSDGISEELLNILAKINDLRVISRTSSFTYKGSNKTASEIGAELNVKYLLEGSVRKDGNRIRVTAQLIDVDGDQHLWSDSYTRELNDLFAVQDEVAQSIVNALKVTMGGVPLEELLSKGTENVRAYNLFLEGRYLWHQRTAESLEQSIDVLKQAVELDPQFSRAWSALADSYILVPEYKPVKVEDYVRPAREASQRALELKPDSSRALTTRAYIRYLYDFEWELAEADFKSAIEISPDYATAHQWYSEMLATLRRFDEAIEQAEIAVRLDPHSTIARVVLALHLAYSEKFDEAYSQLQAAYEMGPEVIMVSENLTELALYQGNYGEARIYANRAAKLRGFEAASELPVIDALENPDQTSQALDYLRSTPFPIDGVYYRPLYGNLLGDKALALDLLEQFFDLEDPQRSAINKIYAYTNLRDEPRFIALLKRVNLEP
jgi:TolB-like protein/Flp pilus assembly protein TadD